MNSDPERKGKEVKGGSGATYESVEVKDEHLGTTEQVVVPVGDDGIVFSADPG